MTDIVEFLRARYAEQLAAIDSWIGKRRADSFSHAEMMAHTTVTALIPRTSLTPYEADALNQRVAEIRSNLLILDEHGDTNDGDCQTCVTGHWGYPTHGGSSPQLLPCRTLRLLALPFTGHADYNQEWTP